MSGRLSVLFCDDYCYPLGEGERESSFEEPNHGEENAVAWDGWMGVETYGGVEIWTDLALP